MDTEFRKDINWFYKYTYLVSTNGIFMMNQDTRHPVHIYVDACITGCSLVPSQGLSQTEFTLTIVQEQRPICELKAVNAVVALNQWTS